MKIHVSIVDYFKAERVVASISCLGNQTLAENINVTIVDNSEDQHNFSVLVSAMNGNKMVTLIQSHENLGYTKATNLSVDSSADYIVLLNPDIQITDSSLIEGCINCLEGDPRLGVVGVAQKTEGGEKELIARSYPKISSQLARRAPSFAGFFGAEKRDYELKEVNFANEGVFVVDWVQSSFWVVKGAVWRELKGLSESYFLFMSEPDFSRRAEDIGYKTAIDCNRFVISDGVRASGVGLGAIFTSAPLRFHILDALKYYFKFNAGVRFF
tara:strand:+ start:954 stop:1763 length:810 start_codon:yes stop_codon:yes gene_type:complete